MGRCSPMVRALGLTASRRWTPTQCSLYAFILIGSPLSSADCLNGSPVTMENTAPTPCVHCARRDMVGDGALQREHEAVFALMARTEGGRPAAQASPAALDALEALVADLGRRHQGLASILQVR